MMFISAYNLHMLAWFTSSPAEGYLAYTWLNVCSYQTATTNIPFAQAVYFKACKTKSLLSETA